jgi:hypothetical protein
MCVQEIFNVLEINDAYVSVYLVCASTKDHKIFYETI